MSELTLDAIRVEQIFAFLMRCESALGTAKTLACQSPQQTLALNTECRRCGRQDDKVVRSSAGDRVNERLQRFLVDVLFLHATIHIQSNVSQVEMSLDRKFL